MADFRIPSRTTSVPLTFGRATRHAGLMKKSAGAHLYLSTLVLIAAVAYLGLSGLGKAVAKVPLPDPRRTGAPGENDCSGCHSGTGGDGSVSVLGLPTSYVPGTVYTLTVQLQDPGQSRWGFEATVLKDSDDTMAGSLAGADGTTGLQAQTGRLYISHNADGTPDGTFAGTANGPVSWPVQWTAPAAGSGSVTIYVAAVSADNDDSSGDTDFQYLHQPSVPEEVSSPVDEMTWGQIKELFP